MIENGVVPELLLGGKYGHAIHFWNVAEGRHRQRIDLGAQHQMALEVRPSHDPEATRGFVGVVISTEDLSGSICAGSATARNGRPRRSPLFAGYAVLALAVASLVLRRHDA